MEKQALQKLIKSAGTIHFIGIGGIGMSGIAEILHNLGYKVQGSDLSENYNTERLVNLGIKVFAGHRAENLAGAGVVVKSSAVKDNNPEIIEAKAKKTPIVKRSEMLAELMRLKISVAVAGTHGKTTTTSLVASLFEAAKKEPTVINGGIINNKKTNAYLGLGEYLIAEADESDATFIKVPATIGIITNIDPEHLDFYGSFDAVKAAFKTFVENLPFYGFAVCCNDHHEVRNLIPTITDRKIITYAIENEADVRAVNIRQGAFGSVFDIESKIDGKAEVIKDIKLPMPGMHNVLNAAAAIAVAIKLDFARQDIIDGFESFEGVKRRFTKTGEVNDILFIDDYAHHPKEIEATLKTAKQVANARGGNVVAIMQPHRFSRLNDLFTEFVHCFKDADTLYIAEVYAAGEAPIAGVSSEILVEAIKQSTDKTQVRYLESPNRLNSILNEVAKPNDLVIFLGAGSVTYWAYNAPKEFESVAS